MAPAAQLCHRPNQENPRGTGGPVASSTEPGKSTWYRMAQLCHRPSLQNPRGTGGPVVSPIDSSRQKKKIHKTHFKSNPKS